MARRTIRTLIAACAAIALLAGGAAVLQAARTPTVAQSADSVVLGMGYVPSVQFAPFYLAAQRGYYRRAGIKVTFDYSLSPNLLQLVAAGRDSFAIADGTDTAAAAAQNLPVEYVATLFRRLPVTIFSLQKSGIRRVSLLRGKSVGVPGRYGSTYAGLLAALHAAGLSSSAVNIRTIGYTQAESVVQGTVAAAVGYSNNEPLLLRRHGYLLTTIDVGVVTDLMGPGLVTGRALAGHRPALLRRFVQATLHGLADTIANPRAAFAAARQVHGLTALRGAAAADQYAVLLRSIALWHDQQTRRYGLGYSDPAQWRRSVRTLLAVGQVSRAVSVPSMLSNTFIAGAPKE